MIEFFFPNLGKRSYELELMDFLDSNKKKLINTIKQFSIINLLFTRSRWLIKKYIIEDMKKNLRNKYSFLNIGAGGCDLPIWLVKYCRKNNFDIRIICLDNDRRVIEYAREKCKDIKEIEIIEGSAFELERLPRFDYIFANHFLHHLKPNKIQDMLELISKNCKKVFVLNDILRSKFAYLGYTLFTGIFMHNSFAFYDGRLSIKKGFGKVC